MDSSSTVKLIGVRRTGPLKLIVKFRTTKKARTTGAGQSSQCRLQAPTATPPFATDDGKKEYLTTENDEILGTRDLGINLEFKKPPWTASSSSLTVEEEKISTPFKLENMDIRKRLNEAVAAGNCNHKKSSIYFGQKTIADKKECDGKEMPGNAMKKIDVIKKKKKKIELNNDSKEKLQMMISIPEVMAMNFRIRPQSKFYQHEQIKPQAPLSNSRQRIEKRLLKMKFSNRKRSYSTICKGKDFSSKNIYCILEPI